MIFALLYAFITLVLDVLATVGVAADEKDLEIPLLRQQLRILELKCPGKKRLAAPDKLMLVMLTDKLKAKGSKKNKVPNHDNGTALGRIV